MRVVIMGGTSGIGAATAGRLADEGMEVIVCGRDEERLAAARSRGWDARRVDGTDPPAVARLFAELGAIEHLVLAHSPGAVGLGPLRELSAGDLHTAVAGKLLAYLDAIRAAEVTESVTMVAAASARAAMPGTVALAAANGALERIVSPLAAELAPVRVNAVSPGVIETPWWSFLSGDERAAQFEQLAGAAPVGRIGTAEDVAAAIAYLIGATFVTATVMAVDGGLTLA